MTVDEAIKQFKERLGIPDYKTQIPEYYEAMELAVKALEKQIPKKPKEHCDNKKLHYCPCCGSYFGGTTGWERCWKCGQKLDWKEVAE